MPNADMFGWALLYKTIEKELTKNADVIVALVHWSMVKNFGLQCLGLGEDKTLSPDEKGDELLPSRWNSDEKSYAMRYRLGKNLYILLGTITEESIIINLLDAKSLDVTNVAFHINDTVKSLTGSLNEIIPNNKVVLDRIRIELLDSISSNSSIHTQTIEPDEPSSQSNLPAHPPRPQCMPQRNQIIDPDHSLRDIGRGDLDPFHRGPGMLYNPPGLNFTPPGLIFPDGRQPPANVPPGARFDPFGPPQPERLQRMGPDNDHFRPPGFNDHMFM